MVLLPSSGTTESNGTGMSLVVLTNPGKLNVYNDIYLSALISQKEKKPSVTAMEYPMFIVHTHSWPIHDCGKALSGL